MHAAGASAGGSLFHALVPADLSQPQARKNAVSIGLPSVETAFFQ